MTCRIRTDFRSKHSTTRWALLACIPLIASRATAEVENGHWLRAQCELPGEACVSYITGVLAGTTMAMAVTSGKTGTTLPVAYEVFLDICVPADQDISIDDQIKVAVAYLDQHPDELQQPAAGLVVTAQQRQWPCPAPAAGE